MGSRTRGSETKDKRTMSRKETCTVFLTNLVGSIVASVALASPNCPEKAKQELRRMVTESIEEASIQMTTLIEAVKP